MEWHGKTPRVLLTHSKTAQPSERPKLKRNPKNPRSDYDLAVQAREGCSKPLLGGRTEGRRHPSAHWPDHLLQVLSGEPGSFCTSACVRTDGPAQPHLQELQAYFQNLRKFEGWLQGGPTKLKNTANQGPSALPFSTLPYSSSRSQAFPPELEENL